MQFCCKGRPQNDLYYVGWTFNPTHSLTHWKTLVAGIVKLFHKFKGGHLERGH